jgi:hypothetical protein
MKIAITLLICGFIAVTLTARNALADPTCTVRSVYETNRNMLPTDQPFIVVPGGGAVVNPYFAEPDSPSDADSESVPARRTRLLAGAPQRTQQEVQALFEESRAAMILEITAGRPDAQLSDTQKIMAERIRTIKIEFADGPGSAAGYATTSHRIVLRSKTLSTPKLALIGLFAHEMGHSVDICSLGTSFYSRGSNRSINLGAGVVDADLATHLNDSSAANTEYLIDKSYQDHPEYLAALQRLTRQGYFTRLNTGVTLRQNPARATYQCLQNRSQYRPLPATQQEVCSNTAFNETGAQIWGARILANYLKNAPPLSVQEKLGLFALAQMSTNQQKTEAVGKEKDYNEIFLSEPATQRALGCTPVPGKICMTAFNPSGRASNVTKTDQHSVGANSGWSAQ